MQNILEAIYILNKKYFCVRNVDIPHVLRNQPLRSSVRFKSLGNIVFSQLKKSWLLC